MHYNKYTLSISPKDVKLTFAETLKRHNVTFPAEIYVLVALLNAFESCKWACKPSNHHKVVNVPHLIKVTIVCLWISFVCFAFFTKGNAFYDKMSISD